MFNRRKSQIKKLLKSIKNRDEIVLFVDPMKKYKRMILRLHGTFIDLQNDNSDDLIPFSIMGFSNPSILSDDILNAELQKVLSLLSKQKSIKNKRIFILYPEKFNINRDFILNKHLNQDLILNFKY